MKEQAAELTWQEMHGIYRQGIAHLKESSQEQHEKGWQQLMELLPEYFPEAVDDAMVLVNMDHHEALRRVTRAEGEKGKWMKVPRSCWEAVRRIYKITRDGFPGAVDVQKLDARKEELGKYEIGLCAEQWLRKQGWQNIERAFYPGAKKELIAEKGGAAFVGLAVRGVMMLRERSKRTGKKDKDGYPIYDRKTEWSEDVPAFKGRLGRVVVVLMEEMSKSKNVHSAMLVADDGSTREALEPFVKYFKKLGIRIYMVRSAEKVEEL